MVLSTSVLAFNGPISVRAPLLLIKLQSPLTPSGYPAPDPIGRLLSDSDSDSLPINRSRRFLCKCSCGRRHFIGAITTTATAFLPPLLSSAAVEPNSPMDGSTQPMLSRIRAPRPEWYEELYALVMNKLTKPYEAKVAEYKSPLFNNLRGKAEQIVEIGIGTGPNLKYYAADSGVRVIGFDPNRKMEKYARAAAEAAGLRQKDFEFIQAIGEALPLSDSSVDAVIGTLVLCSVEDVRGTLREVRRVLKPGGMYLFVEHVGAQDGTFLRNVQNFLDPLQQTVADGCHLTRDTAKHIAEAGFAQVDSSTAFVSNAFVVNPHVYGIAYK